MVTPPERIESYDRMLGQQLHQLVTSVRDYQASKAEKKADLLSQASRLWELNQRYYLVKGENEAASVSLLSACEEVYQVLYDTIINLENELAEIPIQVLDFENLCLPLAQEQVLPVTLVCFEEFIGFFQETVKSQQNQLKYVELHLRQLHPQYAMGESTLVAFKSDLHMPSHIEDLIALGLAKIEELSKSLWDFSKENQKRLNDPQNKVA